MKRQAPRQLGLVAGELLRREGDVFVYAATGSGQLWYVGKEQADAARQLVELGGHGVGGFTASAADHDGIWLVRARVTSTLREFWKQSQPPSWERAVSLALGVARALSICEQREVWPGALLPDEVVVQAGQRVELRAEPLVRRLLGLEQRAEPGRSSRWIAPEQAAGAAWDAAANRYVLGLLLYRLLAGEHPAHGHGLRLGLEHLATRGPPPFSEERGRGLPPGLQGYCLSLLAPAPGCRPASAEAIVTRLEAFLDVSATGMAALPPSAEPERARAGRAEPGTSKSERRVQALDTTRADRLALALALAAVLAGVLLVVLAVSGATNTGAEPGTTERAQPLGPRLGGPLMASRDCESCHPRQTAEWRRSVMAHSLKSPLFLALEALIEEQVGRSHACAHGAGVMRKAGSGRECRDPVSGVVLTGSAGEHWCVNCHAPGENLNASMPSWDAESPRSASRLPLDSLLPEQAREGISCAFCHQVKGPAGAFDANSSRYLGNPSWLSPVSGIRFLSRPEERVGRLGIANSGYALDPAVLLASASAGTPELVPGGAHARMPADVRAYLRSSEFCGACHDVRLFGTDVIGGQQGEHFKRLRNAYSEWREWSRLRKVQGQPVHSCQDCHMSRFPGGCVPGESEAGQSDGCPQGTRFEPQPPGSYPEGSPASNSVISRAVRPHYFTGVDVPLAPEFPGALIDEQSVDAFGLPLGTRQRRALLLRHSVRMTLGEPLLVGRRLELPLELTNTGGGHRIPAGFSQERELWVHLTVTDAAGKLVYEVGRVASADQDLGDKLFLRTNVQANTFDPEGRPLGMFGADVADGPDVPRWFPDPAFGGSEFRGRGLVNFQNGFLRCVVCLGRIDAQGRCQPLPGQQTARADRYADGSYDIDSGRCASNLSGEHALFETYFPVGSLDATRGVLKAPDAIIDKRSLSPEVPVRYTYELPLERVRPPYRIEARLLFRAFPPFLLRAFIDYERSQAARGLRPRGPLIDARALERLDVVELVRTERVGP